MKIGTKNEEALLSMYSSRIRNVFDLETLSPVFKSLSRPTIVAW